MDRLFEEWLKMKESEVRQSSYTHYLCQVRNHLEPFFRGVPVSGFGSRHMMEFSRSLTEQGLSPTTINDLLGILRQVVAYAVKMEYMKPVAMDTVRARRANSGIEVLSEGEMTLLERKILEMLAAEGAGTGKQGDGKNGNGIRREKKESAKFRVALGVLVTMYTGLRLGEICALRWGDLELDEGILKVNGSMKRVTASGADARKKTTVIIGAPKSLTSRRAIPLPSFLAAILRYLAAFFGLFSTLRPSLYEHPR